MTSRKDTCKGPMFLPDTSKPPPDLPSAYGTQLYPPFLDHLDPNLPAELQMKRIRVARKENEERYFHNNKMKEASEVRDKYQYKSRYCDIFSEYLSEIYREGNVITHIHNSSKKYWIEVTVDS